MNVITVTLKDRTKTASCRETVALCAKYALTVSPALEVDEDKTETIDGVLTSTVKGYIVAQAVRRTHSAGRLSSLRRRTASRRPELPVGHQRGVRVFGADDA